MKKESNEKLFKLLCGSIFIAILIPDIPLIFTIFTESWDILKIVYIVTIVVEIFILLIYIGVFTSKKFNKDFISEWRAYRKKNRVLLGIITAVLILLIAITGYVKMSGL